VNGGIPALAIRYALTRWEALTHYVEYGRVEIDNNAVEREIRAVALGRNYAQRSVMRSAGPRRPNDATSRPRALHNHRARRNAASASGGRYRPAFVPGVCAHATACSFMAMSASA